MYENGPATYKVFTWVASCGPCGITIGVRTKESDAAQIAAEHNRIFHPYDLSDS